MTGGVAGAISGGLTVASVIVRMVHDLVRNAINRRLLLGHHLAKDITSTVLTARNLKNLLDKASTLLDDVAATFARIPAKSGKPNPTAHKGDGSCGETDRSGGRN